MNVNVSHERAFRFRPFDPFREFVVSLLDLVVHLLRNLDEPFVTNMNQPIPELRDAIQRVVVAVCVNQDV